MSNGVYTLGDKRGQLEGNFFTLREPLGSPRSFCFGVGSVLLIYIVFCIVMSFFSFLSSSCVFCVRVASVSGLSIPNCPFGFLRLIYKTTLPKLNRKTREGETRTTLVSSIIKITFNHTIVR